MKSNKKRDKKVGKVLRRNIVRNIIIAVILIIIAVIFLSYKGITGNVVSGFAVNEDNDKNYATKVSLALGNKCLKNGNAGVITLGKNNKQKYSSTIEFDISEYSGKSIDWAKACFTVSKGSNPYIEFVVALSAQNSLNCPVETVRWLEGSIKIFRKEGKYCFDIKNYLINSLQSGKTSMFLSLSGEELIKESPDSIAFYGLAKGKKPYLDVEYTPCSTNWSCSEWSECIENKQTRSCTDNNNCGLIGPVETKKCNLNFDKPFCEKDTAGIFSFYDPTHRMKFYLKNYNGKGKANIILPKKTLNPCPKKYDDRCIDDYGVFPLAYAYLGGKSLPNMIPLSGDWNGDGKDTIGFYDPYHHKFHLSNDNKKYDIVFSDNLKSGTSWWYPLAGDWDGDGKDTIGLFNYFEDSTIMIKNNFEDDNNWRIIKVKDYAFSGDNAVYENSYNTYFNLIPFAGDFDGDGVDTIGFVYSHSYIPQDQAMSKYKIDYQNFYLFNDLKENNIMSMSSFDKIIKINSDIPGYTYDRNHVLPISGDWNGDGIDEVGGYMANMGKSFYIKYNQSDGEYDKTFNIIESGVTPQYYYLPVVGNWDGNCEE